MIHNPVSRRRIFINKKEEYFQIFSFSQDDDGSMYVSMPEFPNVKWMSVVKSNNKVGLAITDPIEKDGKLSIHGTGMSAFRPHSDSKGHQLIVQGNFLLNKQEQKLGVRHLFTSFLQEPMHLPNSPVLNRTTDYLLKSSKGLQPFFIIFFAVPLRRMAVEINAGFHINDVSIPPVDTGWGGFSLKHHMVVWFYYRTKNMERWPANTHVCYYDGYKVPFFIGTSKGICRLEIRHPSYVLNNDTLTISIPMVEGAASVVCDSRNTEEK